MKNLALLQTRDRSHTIYVPELDETYHSRNGAIQESIYVYIQMGLEEAAKVTNTLHILEIGFGTGLNAWLTLIASQNSNLNIHYHTLEPYPLPYELITGLNYTTQHAPEFAESFSAIHQAPWECENVISPSFILHKNQISLANFLPDKKYDLMYFDAFGPDKQPEIWQPDNLTKLYLCLNNGGIWVTYAAKGEVKRNLKQIGFEVQRLPGPPMKRHMLRAIKPHA